MEYKASLDTLAKVITGGVVILLLYLGWRSAKTLMAAPVDITTFFIHGGILILFISIIAGSFLYSPRKYLLTNDSIIIKRPISDVSIPFTEIAEIRKIDPAEFSSTVRTFGVGGLFGYFGKYHDPRFGHMNWYATSRNGKILVKTKKGKTIIITPDDASLVNEVQKKVL